MSGNSSRTAAESLQEASANVLSEVKHACKTTQKTADVLVTGINAMMDQYLEVLKEKIHHELYCRDGNIYLSNIDDVLQLFKGQSVFEGIGTNDALNAFLQDQSGGTKVSLKQVVLRYVMVQRNGIPRMIPTKYGYVVSFLFQLEQLLNCPDVLECVDNPLPSKEGYFQSVTDGLLYKYNSIVKKYGPQTLCFLIHVDDAETCDPLKSKANKHCIRLFYWVLANIYPHKRSSLKTINLLAIVKAKVAKEFGNHHFLEGFIYALKMLGTEGVNLIINGFSRRFYGMLLFASADNPAAANLGGFKESITALRPCRMCMVKSSNLNDSFEENKALLRSREEHESYLQQVESFDKKASKSVEPVVVRNVCGNEEEDELEDEELTDVDVSEEIYLDHRNPSVNFGVNSRSILADAPGFDVTKCLPQDLMHLLAEGVVELLCRRLLRYLCLPQTTADNKKVKALIPLKIINQAIETHCDLGHLNDSRPSRIETAHIKGSKLKQSAAQMLVLLHLLPFIVYDACPPEKFALLTQLIRLVGLCMSFAPHHDDLERLKAMIKDFGTSFVEQFPDVKSLKLHCLVHLATQIRLLGPLRQQWCMRYEAMHFKFTSIAPVVRSKKNIAFSCASRYMEERNFLIMKSKESGNYLSDGDTVSSPSEFVLGELPELEKNCIKQKFFDIGEQDVLYEVKQVKKNGLKWQEGVVILLEKNGNNSVFGRIKKVFMKEECIIFLYHEYETLWIPAFNAFKVKRCDTQLNPVSLSELMHPFPITRFSFNLGRKTVAYLLEQCSGGSL